MILGDVERKLAVAVVDSLGLALETSGGIPDADDLKSLALMYETCALDGKGLPSPERVNCINSYLNRVHFPGYRGFKKMGDKIALGIRSAFQLSGDAPTEAEWHLAKDYVFRREFMNGKGMRYFYVAEHSRRNALRDIQEVFSREEARALREMGDALLPYKDRVSAPVQIIPV